MELDNVFKKTGKVAGSLWFIILIMVAVMVLFMLISSIIMTGVALVAAIL